VTFYEFINIDSGGRKMSKIKTAIISVTDKAGVVDFASSLSKFGVDILSTGGTARELREGRIFVTDISDYTGFPEMMDGRVKTLHPKVHGGLLGRRAFHDLSAGETAAHDLSELSCLFSFSSQGIFF